MVLSLNLSFTTSAQTFSPNEVLRDRDFYYLPTRFDSANKIQAFLESQGSVLANYEVNITFHEDENPTICDENDLYNQDSYYIKYKKPLSEKVATCNNNPNDSDSIISPSWTPSQPQRLRPFYTTQSYYGTNMRVSDFVWELARGSLNNGCNEGGLCVDNLVSPISPAFVLAIIQKESGLVMGACSRIDADTNPGCHFYGTIKTLQHRLDRATGFMCHESLDPTKQCGDANPEWKYFKGFFRQVYYSARYFRITVQRCDRGLPPPGFPQSSITGGSLYIDGQVVNPKNGITCAMYIYTPHISSLTASVLKNMQGDKDFAEELGLFESSTPGAVNLF